MMAKSYGKICPCRGCSKRKVGCHSNCAEYNNWKKSGIEIQEPFFEIKKRRKKV